MAKPMENLYNSVKFLPPSLSNYWQQPAAEHSTPVPSASSSPCNISAENSFNLSANVLCDFITEYRHFQVLDLQTSAIVIVGYTTLITIGIVSNVLVCCVVVRQTTHKTSQLGGRSRNLYILNLAIADLALCCITMPLSLHNLLHFYWTLGALLCKIGPFVQATNILVSAGTVTAIAIDRYNTIVRSPRARHRPQDGNSSKAAGIVIIWLLSLLFASPLFFYTQVESVVVDGVFIYDKCVENWPSDSMKISFSIALTCVQFVIPVFILSAIHTKISSYLRRHLKRFKNAQPKIEIHSPMDPRRDKATGIPIDDDEDKRPLQKEFLNIKRKESVCSYNSQRSESSRKFSDCSDSKRLSTPDISPRKRSEFLSSFRENSDFSFSFSKLSRESSKKSVRREMSRNQRTTLLLTCISTMYAVSWLPFHVYNIVTNLNPNIAEQSVIYKAFAAVHLIAMTSVCVNPFLYGWLNTNFRREFLNIHSSVSECFSKVFKKSSTIMNKNSNYDRNDGDIIYKGGEDDLKKKTMLSLMPSKKQDCVVVAIYADNTTPQLC